MSLREAQDGWLAAHSEELSRTWKESFRTSSGIEVEPLYTPADLEDRGWRYEDNLGFPGQAPYTRGLGAGGYRKELWHLEMYAGFGSAADANQRFRYLIEQGSTGGVSIALDLPTQLGLDSDDPLASEEVGQMGVALSSLADVEALFDGIPLDRAGHVFTTANCIAPIAAAWFIVLAEKQGVDKSSFRVQIQNDPIKEYIARGTQFLPIDASVRLACDTVRHVVSEAPGWFPISVSGSHMKQAGASCLQEAAFTIANAIAYTERCIEDGLSIERFGPALELHFCTEMDFFEEIAKYRAVRTVWTRLVRERFGAQTAEAQHFRLHAATSGRPLTAQQPLNNISRITMQVLAQVLGGCEQTRTASFDEALAIPTENAARTSIRINQIIAHETGVPFTVDPLGGSYFLESLTDDFVKGIDRELERIEEMGGSLEATKAGYFQSEIAERAYREQVAVDSGEQVIVGVNRFRVDDDPELPTFELDQGAVDRQLAGLARLRESRDEREATRRLVELENVCRSDDNVMPAVINCVRAYVTTGEIASVWKKVFGEYKPEAVRF